jgi:hypothetical protein
VYRILQRGEILNGIIFRHKIVKSCLGNNTDELEDILLSEKSQAQKDKYHMISIII